MKKKEIAVVDGAVTDALSFLFPKLDEVRKRPTPEEEKFKLPGKDFDYVTVGYMQQCADDAFGNNWDLLTDTEQVPLQTRNVVVKVTLVIKHPETGVVVSKRQAYGGVKIKFLKGTDEALDLGNEYKSAMADGFKKALSFYGICADVYRSGAHTRQEKREDVIEQESVVKKTMEALDPEAGIDEQMWKFILAKATRHSVKSSMVLDFIKTTLGKERPSQVLNKELNQIEKFIETYGK